jgi:flagellar basal body-associated protein FliL
MAATPIWVRLLPLAIPAVIVLIAAGVVIIILASRRPRDEGGEGESSSGVVWIVLSVLGVFVILACAGAAWVVKGYSSARVAEPAAVRQAPVEVQTAPAEQPAEKGNAASPE